MGIKEQKKITGKILLVENSNLCCMPGCCDNNSSSSKQWQIMKLSFNKLKKKQLKLHNEETVLFVCVENAGRSQMAEGFFRKYAPRGYTTLSAGTKPSGDINPLAIEVMKEIGIDISNQKSKEITEDMMRNSTKIVNMGCTDKSFLSYVIHS